MIPVYIGISHRFDAVKGLTEASIRANTSQPVEIVHLYPKKEQGCTGFSNVRYQITYGIYLDCDMIVLGDIAELWSYRKPGKFACIKDGSTEVAVIDCKHSCRNKREHRKLPMAPIIPTAWNVEDYKYFPDKPLPDDMKLFHFTSIRHQPWFYDHPNKEAVELYDRYLSLAAA